jgi:hypothetical protein
VRRARDAEELDVTVAAGPLLDAWVYHITRDVHVLVLIYGCRAAAMPPHLVSPEGQPVGLFAPDALDGIALPAGYRRAVDAWFASPRRSA